MQTVPSPPSGSCTTYERIQRISSDFSSSPTCADRAAAAWTSSGESQPPRRRIAYSFIIDLLSGERAVDSPYSYLARSFVRGQKCTTDRAILSSMSETRFRPEADPRPRRRRSDGERSRNVILREAAQLATVQGIDGLSISRLADAVGMSKSGLFAHFGSKQELQLATMDAADSLFAAQVLEPASGAAGGL